MTHCYDHPRPAVATDIAVFTLRERALSVLLIRRKLEPFAGEWALPGGFLQESEDLDACARRELEEETGVRLALLHHVGNFSAPDRDPRGRVISVAYFALTPSAELEPKAATDASDAEWFALAEVPDLAFDHDVIIAYAIAAVRSRVERLDADILPYLFALLPPRFTLTALQVAYEAILNEPVDKRNFRKRVLDTATVRETGEFEGGSHRPAQLFEAKARQ